MSMLSSTSSSNALPPRQRWLVGAAFVTAVGTGYVASLDGTPVADTGTRLALAPARTLPASTGAARMDRPSSLARGDWPLPTAAALQAWGQALPGRAEPVERDEPASRGRAAAARARVPASPAASSASPAAVVLPPPAWRYIGRIDGEGLPRALLATAQQLHVVAERDTLEGRWRVERIEAHAVRLRALASDESATLPWEAP